MIEIINEENFESKVLDASGSILVEFFATWCPHCERMQPIVDKLAQLEQGNATVYRVDIDQSPSLASKYAPQGFPTFVVFEDGRIVNESTGETTIEKLEELIG